MDATFAPSDIHFPTNVRLLNVAREKLEDIIDTLHQPDVGILTKPRTYRKEALKNYLDLEKQRKKAYKVIRKVIGKNLDTSGQIWRLSTVTCKIQTESNY